VSEELGRQLLAGRALFALLLGMFAITFGCGIVLPILRFLIERLDLPPQRMPRSCRGTPAC